MTQGAESFTTLNVGSSGDKIRTWKDTLGVNDLHTEVVKQREAETFCAIFDRIAPAANKHFTIFNTLSTKKVRIKRILIFNWQVTAVTGVMLEFLLERITARTAGTSATINPLDLNDSLTAGITASSGDTSVTESTVLRRMFSANEEVILATLNTTTERGFHFDDNIVYEAMFENTPLTLRQNQGISLKQITSSTVGSVSIVIEFTEEDA